VWHIIYPQSLFDRSDNACIVAYNHGTQVELAWREVGENWENETLDGKPFELPEPPEGVIWTREDYRLPESGVLSLKYRPTKRVPRMEQVIDEPMFEALCMMMKDKHVTDQGFGLMKLASEEWFFSSRFAGTLAGMFSDSVARVKAMAILMPRVVDLNNWGKLGESDVAAMCSLLLQIQLCFRC
jgi:hypothetical protein